MCFLQQEDYIQHQATIGDHHKQISGGDLEKEIIVTEIVVHQSYIYVEKPFNIGTTIIISSMSTD